MLFRDLSLPISDADASGPQSCLAAMIAFKTLRRA
jgi:hypothetical protein